MSTKGKRYRADAMRATEEAVPLAEAVNRVKAFKATKFDQTVEICMHLGIDPKQADQNLRGSMSLPHGIGQTKRVVAFCPADKIEACKQAGAVEAGDEDLVKKVEDGFMDFDVAVATPDMMRVVARLGRALGPKGLMPSPKSGTVTPDIVQAVKDYTAGKIEFRTDKGGNIHAIVGKHSFDPQQIQDNAQAFIDQIMRMRPASAKGGGYVKKIALTATMTPSVIVAH